MIARAGDDLVLVARLWDRSGALERLLGLLRRRHGRDGPLRLAQEGAQIGRRVAETDDALAARLEAFTDADRMKTLAKDEAVRAERG